MAKLEVVKTYAASSSLFEEDLDNIRQALLNLLNIKGIDEENVQSATIASDKIIDATVSGANIATTAFDDSTMERNTVTNTIQLKDGGITATQLASNAVTAAKVSSGSLLNANFADGSIDDWDKLADITVTTNGSDPGAGGLSSSEGGNDQTELTSTSFADISGLSTTLTTNGGPVLLTFNLADSAPTAQSLSTRGDDATAATDRSNQAEVRLLRDGAEIARYALGVSDPTTTTNFFGYPIMSLPTSCIKFIDDPTTAGTYTYKLQGKWVNGYTAVAGGLYVDGAIVAYEL